MIARPDRLALRLADAVQAVCTGRIGPSSGDLPSYQGPPPGGLADQNQFLLLLKPGLLDPATGVRVRACLDLVLGALARAGVTVAGVRVLSASYADEQSLVERTYHTLSKIAAHGTAALSEHASRALTDLTADLPQPTVLSGYEFLDAHPEFTAASLCALVNHLPVTKLGAGAYAHVLDISGTRYVVLNGFYPHQRALLTKTGTALVALECWSARSFSTLRAELVGDIWPAKARSASLRREIFDRRAELGVTGGNPQANYVHISPGPAEAACHMIAFFFDAQPMNLARTNLGALLAADGERSWDQRWLAANPEVDVGEQRLTLFDVSEGMDTRDFLRLTRKLPNRQMITDDRSGQPRPRPCDDGTTALDQRSVDLRLLMLDALAPGASAHIASAFSLVEILRVLYDDYLRVRPQEPDWPERDRLVLSKGHGCLALYAMLADKGFITRQQLATFGQPGSPLGGHPERGSVPGVEASTGSLGHGLSLAVGMALAARIRSLPRRVVVVTGDGELNEGSVWEAALYAAKHQLAELTVIVDRNGWQCNGPSDEIAGLEPLAAKFRSFGFGVRDVAGHSIADLRDAMGALPIRTGKPSALICHTVKGRGIPGAQDRRDWHYQVGLTAQVLCDLRAQVRASGPAS